VIDGDDIEAKIKATKFLVEATGAEQHFLWSLHARYSHKHHPSYPSLTWEQHACGSLVSVGNVQIFKKQSGSGALYEQMPVCVSLTFATIDGAVVCFWDATSQVIDYRLVEKWLNQKFAHVPPREGRTNAMNFHIVTNALRDGV
jgi:hypothetical protein